MRGNWKHGMSDTKIYNRWYSMLARCKYPSHTSWKWYGALGIKVCERWLSFELFLLDMGPPPFPGASIERKNNNGNYEPGNCYWATPKQQQRNKSTNLLLTLNGRTQSAADWADEVAVPYDRILNRKSKGWSDERALTEPQLGFMEVTIDGITRPLVQWAKSIGMKPRSFWWRVNNGWTGRKLLQAVRRPRVALEGHLNAPGCLGTHPEA